MNDFIIRKAEARKDRAVAVINAAAEGLKPTERGMLFYALRWMTHAGASSAKSESYDAPAWQWWGKRLSFSAQRNAIRSLVKKGLITVEAAGPLRGSCYGVWDEGEGTIGDGDNWTFYGEATFYRFHDVIKNSSDSHGVAMTQTQATALYLSDMSNKDLDLKTTRSYLPQAFVVVPRSDLAEAAEVVKEYRDEIEKAITIVQTRSEWVEEFEARDADPLSAVKEALAEAIEAESVAALLENVNQIIRDVKTEDEVERERQRVEQYRGHIAACHAQIEEWVA